MKSDRVTVTLTEEMVVNYEKIFGKQKSLPPSFPMLFYQFIPLPWEYGGAPIHRKQLCFCQKKLVIGETYRCEVTLDRKVKRGKNSFYTQSLIGYDYMGEECFRCVSELAIRLP
ncbi:hypothetical protein [Oceanobacillus chungangensis]|uniref:N-terminal of MaoC-like dehydratase domain-containing protein n=1 Tax=Oceanobacillus chungangensis TaxID=1229152 RepID=A0A3D8PUN7_9BACI|nr:hypothetical protein [Oceanobacillus chungangensis]RDW19714.1 hypothetical protein CWR45_06460 [Oceanobacillus chungangensis]